MGITPAAMNKLLAYQYPGNIRELKNIIEYAANVCRKKNITVENLPQYITIDDSTENGTNGITEDSSAAPVPLPDQPQQQERPVPHHAKETWQDIERQMIIDALKTCSGNRTKTAETLKWGRMKLWRKMKLYGLQ